MPKQKAPKGAAAASSKPVEDSRFANFTTDPKFRLPSKKNARTKVDKRFSRMLKDEEFTNTAKVDRYGRKVDASGKKKALQRLYELGDSDEDTSDEEDNEEGLVKPEVEDDDVVERELKRLDKAYDPARGGGFSSSEDEDDEDDEEEEAAASDGEQEYPSIQAEQGEVETGEVTKRLAVVNLDWDNIKAEDLMAVFSSFAPATGKIRKVTVYPSEFGRERMEREEIEGPPRELFKKAAEEDDESDEELDEDEEDEKIKNDLLKEDEGEEFDSAALRQYQLERLRYYYAVLECSDEETAQKIYELTDGSEYLTSANFIDLRFIPDDVEFDEKPRDSCTSVPAGYKPTEFVTEALTHSKVKMTWDAEDNTRKDVIKRAFTGSRDQLNENDLKAYLGSDSSDDEDEDEAPEDAGEAELDVPKLTKKELARQKMRAALGLTDDVAASKASKGPVGDMQITFTSGLGSGNKKGSVFENEPVIEETTVEKYIRKEKERKAKRKDRAKAKREGRDPDAEGEDAESHDEGAAGAAGEDDLGFDDPFFASDTETREKSAKKNKSLQREERRAKREAKEAEAAAKASQRAELELLMEDNSNEVPEKLSHFDIKEIAKAEKAKKKKQRSRKDKAVEGGKRGGLQEDFEMNVSDPRFKAVFESHEYAIDPSNPKFLPTEGMKKLLDEGRKKRSKGENMDEVAPVSRKRKGDADATEQVDLQSLVDKVKKKAKR